MTSSQLTPTMLHELERVLLAFRYAYYVECDPIVPDRTYDLMEQTAREVLPASSPIQRVGSDLASDYPADIVELAQRLRAGEHPLPRVNGS